MKESVLIAVLREQVNDLEWEGVEGETGEEGKVLQVVKSVCHSFKHV